MTDNEIIKALACCKNADCLNCPRWSIEWHSGMCNDFLSEVLSFINRQKAEIESFQNRLHNSRLHERELCKQLQDEKYLRFSEDFIKSEARKEFAERLKLKLNCIPQCHFTEGQVLFDIDKLLKEMEKEHD